MSNTQPNDQKSEGRSDAFWNNPDKVKALEAAFANDATIAQACVSAKIARSSYQLFKKHNPDMAESWESLTELNKLKAKANIVEKVHEGDIGLSQWYLERRAGDFIPKQKQHLSDAEGNQLKHQAVIVPIKMDEPKDDARANTSRNTAPAKAA